MRAVYAIYEDRSGTFWMTADNGLFRFERETERFRAYRKEDGLPTDVVKGILEDDRGHLWLSTARGLSTFDPEAETFRNYDAADGTGGNEFSKKAVWKAADGRLFFGGTHGLTAFYPDQIRDNLYKPPVVLTELRVQNIPVEIGEDSYLQRPLWDTEHVTFGPEDSLFSLEFAALSYAAPHKNRYRYILEGLDEGWTEVGSARRFATYTRLDAGEYVFRVQGSNNNGIWNEQGAAVKITVLPPWWETFWFRISLLIGVCGAVLAGYRWKVSTIEGRNRLLGVQVAERTRELQTEKELAETLRHKAESAQKASEAANLAKSAFLANMSHELRSPLNAILGFAQVMARTPHTPEQQEHLSIIKRSGEHLLTLIDQVLDLAKIESGRLALNPSNFDLHRLLYDVQDMFTLKADAKGLRLLVEIGEHIPRYIRADEVRLRQVLINLLNNAVKFTDEGGVKLEVTKVTKVEEDERTSQISNLKFKISDTGPGIAPEEIGEIFENFGQSKTGRQSKEGTGLGLSISRKFVQLMGGEMQATSDVGHGATFTFTICCETAASIEPPRSTHVRRAIALEPGQAHYRILIVDDRSVNRRLVVELLKPFEFELREAANGQEALDICERWKPHLVWMDMRMPVMDGYEATRRIRAWEGATRKPGPAGSQSHVKIVALTASSLKEERSVILDAGCDDYLRKPFREHEAFDLLSKHLGVRFVYEEEPEQQAAGGQPERAEDRAPLTPESLAALPPEWQEDLRQGAEDVELDMLSAVIEQIRARDAALAAALTRLVENFAYDDILELLPKND